MEGSTAGGAASAAITIDAGTTRKRALAPITIVILAIIAFMAIPDVASAATTPGGSYIQGRVYIGYVGWTDWKKDVAADAGNVKNGQMIDGIQLRLVNTDGVTGSIRYRVYQQKVWSTTDFAKDGGLAGGTDVGRAVEDVRIWLTGTIAKCYSVRYTVVMTNKRELGHASSAYFYPPWAGKTFTVTNSESTDEKHDGLTHIEIGKHVKNNGLDVGEGGCVGVRKLTATLVPKTYQATFNPNGGLINESTASVTKVIAYASPVLESAPTTTRSGYVFAGWYTKASGGTKITSATTMPHSNVTYYAHWIPTATVKYHANGGAIANSPYHNGNYYYRLSSKIVQQSKSSTSGFANLTATVKTTDTFKDLHNVVGTAKITRTGYHVESTAKYFYITKSDGAKAYFNADNTAKSTTNAVTTKRLNGGTQITAPTTVTLYVNWQPNTYVVTYDGNGADYGETPDSAHVYDQESALSENGFGKTDYRFTGWNTAADGSGTAYSNGQSVKNLTAENNGTVTLYAQWEPVTTAELYVDNLAEPWRVVVATPRADGTWAVPAELTAEAQREGCTHTDGTPGLEAWFNDEEFKERYEPRTLEPGVVRLYARNWATVSYHHAGDVDPGRTYTAPDGTTGAVAVASKTPPPDRISGRNGGEPR